MSRLPVRSQPAFRTVVLAALLVATWIYDYIWNGAGRAGIYAAGLDLALLVILGLIGLFVFSQFVLPVTMLRNRLRIAGRLWLHAWGAHGAAVFVQNGRKIERRGEAARAGPGLVWVDTASAVLTRTEAGPRRVLGPGIHFMDSHEQIEKTLSLHTQTCSIGPGQDEPIFERLAEDAGEERRKRYEATQAKRREASGLTRDGNEVVPEIRVTFRLDGQPAPAGQPGSRFGFSREAVERAARSEGMNVDPVTSRRVQVAWNQLPGLIAVDLWREYLAKFTLDDLFSAHFDPVPEVLQPELPVQAGETEAGAHAAPHGGVASVLWQMNRRLQRINDLGMPRSDGGFAGAAPGRQSASRRAMLPGRQYTPLQVVAHMVWARMAQAAVPALDESGRYGKGHFLSEEYKRLHERGLHVVDVTLSGFRFAPAIEQQIVQQWRSAWLEHATGERNSVEQLEVLAAEAGRQRALLDHADALSSALRAEPRISVPAALQALLRASRTEILTDERLHGTGGDELQAISALAKWAETASDA